MILDVAISSIARVIFIVDWTDRIRRRVSRSFAPMPASALERDAGRARRLTHGTGLLLELLLRRAAEPPEALLLLLGQRLRVVLSGLRPASFGRLEGLLEVLDRPAERLGRVVRERPAVRDPPGDLRRARLDEHEDLL